MGVLDRPEPVRVILFDAVGTLLRPWPPVAETYHAAALRFGTKRTLQEVRQRFAVALRRYPAMGVVPITAVGPRPTGQRVPVTTSEPRESQRWRSIVSYVFDDIAAESQSLFQSLWEHFARSTSWQLFDDVLPVWKTLAADGYRLGLASNFDARLVSLCRSLPPLHTADYCFISSSLKYPKPHPRFYREIQHQLGLPAGQLLMVGDDRQNDFEAPRAAGWNAVHLCRQGEQHQESISSLQELLGIL